MKRAFLFALALTVSYVIVGSAQQQYPMVDMIAGKVVQKYQSSTCEQLWQQKAKKAPPSQQEQEAIQMLKANPGLRAAFINQIAAPIANKMFDCGMIP